MGVCFTHRSHLKPSSALSPALSYLQIIITLQLYMDKLDIVQCYINWLVCGDLKVANAAIGIMTHTARYPCHVCKWVRGHPIDAFPHRSFEGIAEKHQEWVDAGADPSKLKDYENCQHPPLPLFPSVGSIPSKIAPSGLHFKLGVVNDAASGLVKVFPEATTWMDSLKIKKGAYHGGQYEGRECDVLLNNIDKLRDLVAKASFTPRATRSSTAQSLQHPAEPFIELFQAMKNVKVA